MEDEDRPPDTVTTSDKEPDGAMGPKDTTGEVTNAPNETDTGATDTSAHSDVNNNKGKNIDNMDITNKLVDKLVDTPFIKRVEKDKTVSPTLNNNFTNKSIPPGLQESPTTPNTGKLQDTRDYRMLYYQMKRRVLKLTEDNACNLTTTTAELKTMKKLFSAVKVENVRLEEKLAASLKKLEDYKIPKDNLVSENKMLEDRIKSLEQTLAEKDILLDRKTAELIAMKESLDSNSESRDKDRQEYETLIKEFQEKENKISTLEEELKEKSEGFRVCSGLHRINSDETFCRLKPKTRKSTKSNNNKDAEDKLECEYEGCKGVDVDLIKCNMCCKWVCEDCNDVQVSKLKPIINKCRTIHFLCKSCDEKIGTDGMKDRAPPTNHVISTHSTDMSTDTIASLKSFLSEQVTKIENNLKGMIETKLGESKKEITALNETLSKVKSPVIENDNNSDSATNTNTWSSVASRQQDIKILMRDAKNDEKIEENEKERRAKNIIIHGADEVGNNPEEIKKEDANYIREIFKKIAVPIEPLMITRLGEPTESKSRPIKIVMKSKADKDKVMKNLGLLKGTERYFGKISVKDDYTTQEREGIKLLTERAKKQANENPERIFKVRGNSKNGWRVVSFPKEM